MPTRSTRATSGSTSGFAVWARTSSASRADTRVRDADGSARRSRARRRGQRRDRPAGARPPGDRARAHRALQGRARGGAGQRRRSGRRRRTRIRRVAARPGDGERGTRLGARAVGRGACIRGARARRRAAARHERRLLRPARRRAVDGRRVALSRGARTRGRPQPARAPDRGRRSAARARRDLQGRRRRARTGVPVRTRFEGGPMKDVVRTEAAPAPFQGAPYSQAIKANGFVFVSGQLALEPGHAELMGGEISAQTEQVIKNLRAILEEAGSSLDQLVKTTVFLQNLDDFAGMNEVYAKHMGSAPPARSTVEVAKLPSGALVEIEAIALV